MEERTIVISVGGSLLIPNEIDIQFILKFHTLILSYTDVRFVLVTGGGAICRAYQEAAKQMHVLDKQSLDWVGIMVTRVNAELLRVVFDKNATNKVTYDPRQKEDGRIIIAAGHLPGCSTDYDAVVLARTYNASLLINLFNQDYIYDQDPRQYPDATPLPVLRWDSYIDMVGTEWIPGSHMPFDPVAAQAAKQMGLKVILANGANLPNLKKIIDGENFVGTVLQ